jgi:hypothetical protein
MDPGIAVLAKRFGLDNVVAGGDEAKVPVHADALGPGG